MSVGCPMLGYSLKPILVTDMAKVSSDLFKECPGPLAGKTPRVTTIGNSPYLLSIIEVEGLKQGKKIRNLILEPGTGNPYGIDYDMTALLCEKLKTNHFILRTTKDNSFDHFDHKNKQWRGRGGEVIVL